MGNSELVSHSDIHVSPTASMIIFLVINLSIPNFAFLNLLFSFC